MSELLEALYRGDAERVAQLRARNPELNVFEAAAFGETEHCWTGNPPPPTRTGTTDSNRSGSPASSAISNLRGF